MHKHTDSENELRNRLVKHLKGGNAFTPIDTLIEKVPFHKIGTVPEACPIHFTSFFTTFGLASTIYCNIVWMMTTRPPNGRMITGPAKPPQKMNNSGSIWYPGILMTGKR